MDLNENEASVSINVILFNIVGGYMGNENRNYVGVEGNLGPYKIRLELDFEPGMSAITSSTVGDPEYIADTPYTLTITNKITGNQKLLHGTAQKLTSQHRKVQVKTPSDTINDPKLSYPKSGDYGHGLKIAYNPDRRTITGFYKSYTGWNDELNVPRFSCIFYFSGRSDTFYFPIKTQTMNTSTKYVEKNQGNLNVKENEITIKLKSEHGGCWNVTRFSQEHKKFILEKEQNWVEIRQIVADRSYFYSTPNVADQLRSYMVRGDFFFVELITDSLFYGKYIGESITQGWIKSSTTNDP
jgi:hypothetical protein